MLDSNLRYYPADEISSIDKQSILSTLKNLEDYYKLRDVSKIEECINKTIDTTSIFILGTNPEEVFKDKKEVSNLFYCDWKFWGNVRFDLDQLYANRMEKTAYVVFPGSVMIDVWNMEFPLQVSGLMIYDGSKWVFSKMQFQYGWNTNYIIFAKIAAYGALFSFILLLLIKCTMFFCRKKA